MALINDRRPRLFIGIGDLCCVCELSSGDSGSLVVGRDLSLLENGGIFVEDSTISDRHAVLSWSFRGDQSLVVVQDCGSKNGTMINEQMLSPGAVRLLTDGDSVYIGCSVEIKFFLGFPQTGQALAV